MTLSLKFKSLIGIALLNGMSSFVAAGADDGKNLAQEATAVEANIS